jgi:hypothetical protein
VNSIYKALIQADVPVDNNNKKMEDEDTAENRSVCVVPSRGVTLTNDNVVKVQLTWK